MLNVRRNHHAAFVLISIFSLLVCPVWLLRCCPLLPLKYSPRSRDEAAADEATESAVVSTPRSLPSPAVSESPILSHSLRRLLFKPRSFDNIAVTGSQPTHEVFRTSHCMHTVAKTEDMALTCCRVLSFEVVFPARVGPH